MAKRNNAYFNFCGEFVAPKKRPLMEETSNSFDGRSVDSRRMSFGVKDGSNMVFVESYDSAYSTIHTYDRDGNPIDVNWEDRLDPAVIDLVASYRRYVVNLSERVEFITAYDMMEYLAQELPKHTGDIVVTGQFTIRPVKDGYRNRFNISGVYAANSDDKRRFVLRADLFYNRDSVDKSDMKSNDKIYLNGHIPMYVNKEEGEKYFPLTAVFNTGVYDLDNPKHKALFEYRTSYIDIKQKNLQHMMWELRIIDGAEEVQFDESCLTPAQKQQVELGIRTVEDFRPRGTILGDRIKEFRLKEPILTNEFADGLVDSGFTPREFEEMIYVPHKDESLADVLKSTEKKNEKPPFDASEEEDLF